MLFEFITIEIFNYLIEQKDIKDPSENKLNTSSQVTYYNNTTSLAFGISKSIYVR